MPKKKYTFLLFLFFILPKKDYNNMTQRLTQWLLSSVLKNGVTECHPSATRTILSIWQVPLTAESLCSAVEGGRDALAVLLLQAGVDPNDVPAQKTPALHIAVGQTSEDLVAQLCTHGADPNRPDPATRRTPLQLAVSLQALPVVTTLLKNGADPEPATVSYKERSCLHEAVVLQNVDLCTALLQAGADPNYADCTGRTVLLEACRLGVLGICEEIVRHGGTVATPGPAKRTALHEAALNGHLGICTLLLESGADPLGVDSLGWTPLMDASRQGHLEVCRLLMEKQRLGRKGCSSVMRVLKKGMVLALDAGHAAVFRLFLAENVSIDAPLNELLLLACAREHTGIAGTLIGLGAEVNTCDDKGRTPLMVAAAEGNVELTALLVAEGASPHAADDNGATPLLHACGGDRPGTPKVCRLLLESGAEADAVDNAGRSPLAWARLAPTPVREVLLSYGAHLTPDKRVRSEARLLSASPSLFSGKRASGEAFLDSPHRKFVRCY